MNYLDKYEKIDYSLLRNKKFREKYKYMYTELNGFKLLKPVLNSKKMT